MKISTHTYRQTHTQNERLEWCTFFQFLSSHRINEKIDVQAVFIVQSLIYFSSFWDFFSYLLQLLFHTSSSSFLASIIESSAGNSLLLFMPSNKHQQHNDAEKKTQQWTVSRLDWVLVNFWACSMLQHTFDGRGEVTGMEIFWSVFWSWMNFSLNLNSSRLRFEKWIWKFNYFIKKTPLMPLILPPALQPRTFHPSTLLKKVHNFSLNGAAHWILLNVKVHYRIAIYFPSVYILDSVPQRSYHVKFTSEARLKNTASSKT